MQLTIGFIWSLGDLNNQGKVWICRAGYTTFNRHSPKTDL